MKKIFKFIRIIFILGILGTLFQKMNVHTKLSNTKNTFNQEAQEFFTEQLKGEKLKLWTEIRNEFGIDLSTVGRNSLQRKPTLLQKIDNPTAKLVCDVAQEYNVDPNYLEVIIEHGNKYSPAYSNEHNQIIIEMNLFALMPKTVQKFIIAHELHHIVNNDFQESRQLKSAAKKCNLTAKQKDLLAKYGRFQEKRADICAALKGVYWAESYHAFAKEGIKRASSDPGIEHPTYKERAQIAQNILNVMHNGVQTT